MRPTLVFCSALALAFTIHCQEAGQGLDAGTDGGGGGTARANDAGNPDTGTPSQVDGGGEEVGAGSVYHPVYPRITQEYKNPEKDPPPFAENGLFLTDTGCKVNKALILSAGAAAHAPLIFPLPWTPPSPGSTPANVTGALSGTSPGPDLTNHDLAGYGFEYHSDLNNLHGCFSQQFKSTLSVEFNVKTNQLDGPPMDKDPTGNNQIPGLMYNPPHYYHDGEVYAGNTRTGVRQFAIDVTPVPIYEGTPSRIHWVDAPSIDMPPHAPVANGAIARYVKLRSVTWDADGKHGWLCDTTTIVVIDTFTENRWRRTRPPRPSAHCFPRRAPRARLSATATRQSES